MSNRKALCLNMIVKNELANLERCLTAVAPHIGCWVIGDTGSSDGTQDFIMSFFAARSLPGELHSFPFENFEQARNAALDHAYASLLSYDYLLFCDADMELVVDDPDFRALLRAPGYRLIQRTAGGLTYWNTRLARRDAGARYHGVTHEYLDVPGEVEPVHGVWYTDHASGSNRVDKFERDIRLLTKVLEAEPENQRYWFYLAQSLKDAGRTAEAAETYAKRAHMGGWEEEAWYAQMMQARCLRDLGDEGGFLREALAAFNRRPIRAEPLYDLARYYRERSKNETSVLFSEAGLAIARPEEDVLFLEDFVYTAGLKEEYSIAANYARDSERKARGFAACNWLALSREVPMAQRNLARSNLYYYLEPAGAIFPSFTARAVPFTPPTGYRPSNPSVARRGREILLVQRAVNYTVTGGRDYHTPNGEPIHTRNFLLRLNNELETQTSTEILPPIDMPEPRYQEVLGLEDLRLFVWRKALWCVATIRELTQEGWCEQVLARIEESVAGSHRLTDWRVLRPEGPRLHEKNWVPLLSGDRLQFIYRCDPTRLLDDKAQITCETAPPIAAENFCGGSQAIMFAGGWLALVHEANVWVSSGGRTYRHRFVWFDDAGAVRAVSRPFYFRENGLEFAAGLTWHPDGERLLVSYGVGDGESWIATVSANEVRAVLEDVQRLQSGLSSAMETIRKPWDEVAKSDLPSSSTVFNENSAHVSADQPELLEALDGLTDRSSAPTRVWTSHGTILYVDFASGELRHGPPASSPLNTQFVEGGGRGQILYETDGRLRPVVCLKLGSQTVDIMERGGASSAPTMLDIIPRDQGRSGLRADGLFLCAEADGRVTLTRTECRAWESFVLSATGERPIPGIVGSTEKIFFELAPFLDAANSPVDRRRLSRGFDARIAPLLDGADTLPQIHCFYEVLSDATEHHSLLAATASMRAAGHAVRVWSYAPQKLEFLRSQGIELRQAGDVVPKRLFERIISGSEIRYFSDIFRYAVLYEQGGLWMDGDVVLLRPFPFRGDHFLNLQWRGGHQGHFVCGNVMYAHPFSRHLRALYEMSIERFFASNGKPFGEVGPKLLSDYVASDAGSELRARLFSPMFFNPIDWMEVDRFNRPIGELAEYLNDDRVFGIHLWNARTNAVSRCEGTSLISQLSNPLENFPSLIDLADRFDTDKNRHTGNRHFYARAYERLLSSRRFSLRRLMEIGLCRGLAERNQPNMPSVEMWQTYFPFAEVLGVDVTDFSRFHDDRFSSFVCDQSKLDELRSVAARVEPGSLDVIIDDGSHASYDEQMTLREFFPLLKEGGWYFIEDLDWQPPGEDYSRITMTKHLLREIQQCGSACSIDPLGISELTGQIAEILFFDSHYELERATLMSGLAAIRKRGGMALGG